MHLDQEPDRGFDHVRTSFITPSMKAAATDLQKLIL
ncbi:Hypothetical protein Cp106_0501 [Corynebacterium pseudotuberculosis 1/06-A]|nr:Hypothetical protein Cp106_0501 [Corynebacterium pseudotuberculosis 1/06-A]